MHGAGDGLPCASPRAIMALPMGPIVILDKSALQGLSGEEIDFLQKHYYVNVVPILIMEILADLKKIERSQLLSAGEVVRLARKLREGDSGINADYRTLCAGSLLGNLVPMQGSCVVGGGEPIHTADGQAGVFIDTPPERWAIMRWQDGMFEEAEEALASRWRRTTAEIDLTVHRDRLKRAYLVIPSCSSLTQVREALDNLLAQLTIQQALLEWLLEEHDLPASARDAIKMRWVESGATYLDRFAPYAAYCLRVELSFIIALRDRLIGTRRTNRLDLEYCFYLPFCMAFVSGDKLHADLAKLFLREDQEFVQATELKRDLRAMAAEWQSLSDEQRRQRQGEYGWYPPPQEDSITCKLWERHMRPRSADEASMSPGERQRLHEHLRSLIQAVEARDRRKSGKAD